MLTLKGFMARVTWLLLRIPRLHLWHFLQSYYFPSLHKIGSEKLDTGQLKAVEKESTEEIKLLIKSN